MFPLKLMLDTNIVLDFLNHRDPYFERARLLMIAGQVGEFSLWISTSQLTDIIYIASEGGKHELMSATLERLRAMRLFVNVCPITAADADRMLATTWPDPEDALLSDLALSIGADALVTRDAELKKLGAIDVFTCEELFSWLERKHGISYAEVPV